MTPSKQKLFDFVLHNQRFIFLKRRVILIFFEATINGLECIGDIFLRRELIVDFQTYFKDSLCLE